MTITSTAPEKLPLPAEGGSYVRQGEDLQLVEQTGPSPAKPATDPVAAPAPATPKE